MIIHAIRARNVLKYARLELNDLAEKALIAISGSNESGKTTVVETICLALYGRTFSLASDEIHKSIRWGETSSNVELEFSLPNGERYMVSRSLALDGVQGATLKNLMNNAIVASGSTDVHDAIVKMGGFTFEQYLDSLYLAQREISAPHSQSDTIKAVAGGMRLEAVADELEMDILAEKRAVKAVENDVAAVQARIDELGLSDENIPNLEDDVEHLNLAIQENEHNISIFRQVSDDVTLGVQRLIEAGREVLEASTGLSFAHWRDYVGRLTGSINAIEEACEKLETENVLCEGEQLKSFVWELQGKLGGFDIVRERARELRTDIALQLGETDREEVTALHIQQSLPHKQGLVHEEMARNRRWLRLLKFGFIFTLLVAIISGAGWWFLVEQPDSGTAVQFAAYLHQYVPFWQDNYKPYLLPVAGVAAVITVLLLLRMLVFGRGVRDKLAQHLALGRDIEALRHRAELLDYMDSMAFAQALESLDELGDAVLSERLGTFADGPARMFTDEDELQGMQERLHSLLESADLEVRSVREDIASAVGALDNESERCRREIAVAEEGIAAELEKQARARVLQEDIDRLTRNIPLHEEQIRLLQLSRDLVRQTCQNLYSRFNKVLRKYTGEVMPKLTDGRYQHLQIDDDLTVRVFSSDKNDFADLGEVSSGTQRQIMLAVRLAMAKALAEAAVQGRQFLILDEPFAFFDQERIRSTLDALPNIDTRLTQIWIIAQEFDPSGPFMLRLDCSREADTLVV